jgi:hypothetical protein
LSTSVFSLSDGRVWAARSWAAAFFLGHKRGRFQNFIDKKVLNTSEGNIGFAADNSPIQKTYFGGSTMNTWCKKFFAFLLALIAISVFAGPMAVSASAATAPAAQHGKRHHHRRHHHRPHHHR